MTPQLHIASVSAVSALAHRFRFLPPFAWLPWLLAIGQTGLLFALYAPARHGPFVLDDSAAIVENASIRHWSTAFSPPADRGLPVTGRPLVNATFALNYRWSGTDPAAYRLTNVALHALNALLLAALLRQTLRLLRIERGGWIAWMTALLWSVHPLCTAAVAYVSQRSEVLVACWWLAALACLATAATSARRSAWETAAVACCWLGMTTKEVMAAAPLVLLAYDWFILRPRDWRSLRWPVHAANAASWLWLGVLLLHTGGRVGTAGFGLAVSPWQYGLTQCWAIAHYLGLALWPASLVFDYGGSVLISDLARIVPAAAVVGAVLALTIWAVWKRRPFAVAALLFLGVLAPTSSIVPIADTIFEHRMYLPVAAVMAVFVTVVTRLGRWMPLLLIAPLALLTARRAGVYRSEAALWTDTLTKRPDSARAAYTLGVVIEGEGDLVRSEALFRRALALDPRSAPAHNDLGNLLARTHRPEAAAEEYRKAIALHPTAEAYNNLGSMAAGVGDLSAAEADYRAAVKLRPGFADAHANLANVLAQRGAIEAALSEYDAALSLKPDLAAALFNRGITLSRAGRWQEAVRSFEQVLRVQPAYPNARAALEAVRARADR
jgi:tetratricopeptide (TPR) repeat protein